jgi:membrane protease subunit HflC
MRLRLILILLIPVAALLARTCLFTVDRTEYVYLTQMGRHVDTFDGADPEQAGLHVKWPWPVQSVQSFDRRLQYFDLPGAELLTRDPKGNTIDRTLTVDAYVCWRIAGADGVDRFVRSVGSPAGAQAILGQRVNSELGAAVGRLELEELVGTDPAKVDRRRDELRRQLMAVPTRDEYGIEVVDVRLRRLNHPAAVRDAIFERIRSERQQKAARYQSDGEYEAANIRSAADREVAELKAKAEADALAERGKADAEADAIRNEAARADPQFYAFLKKLEEYQRILGDGKTVLLLSTHRELFDLLFSPPVPAGGISPTPPVAGKPSSRGNGGH